MEVDAVGSLTVVLAGGGVLGIAWTLGYADGLRAAGVDLAGAGTLIGTSAGAVVATQIATGCLDEAVAMQQRPSPEVPFDVDLTRYGRELAAIQAEAGNAADAGQRLAAYRYGPPLIDVAERRAVVAARLPVQDWPDPDLRICAVDAETGQRAVFTRDSGVPLVDAVAASCALPGIWPLTVIDGHRYLDGGIWSNTSADLAHDRRPVLVVVPVQANPFLDAPLARELKSYAVPPLVVRIDEASLAVLGPNALDPARRGPAVVAGREQAARDLAAVRGLLGG